MAATWHKPNFKKEKEVQNAIVNKFTCNCVVDQVDLALHKGCLWQWDHKTG